MRKNIRSKKQIGITAAEGYTSDDRKRSKYPYMKNVQFFSVSHHKKRSKNALEMVEIVEAG